MVITGLFFVVLMINTFILVFDFPRATSLTSSRCVSPRLLEFVDFGDRKTLAPTGHRGSGNDGPTCRECFLFICTSIGMACLYGAIFLKVRFDYWELSNNELLHHHGFLSDLKRYPAPNLRVDKEINDVFEYMLLGAGRLILHPSTEKRIIVLDNILHVSEKEKQLTRMLGSIKVQINSTHSE